MNKKRRNPEGLRLFKLLIYLSFWLWGQDFNLRPSGYEPDDPPIKSNTYAATRQKLDSRVASRCKFNYLQRLFCAILLLLFFAPIFQAFFYRSDSREVTSAFIPPPNSFDARVRLMAVATHFAQSTFETAPIVNSG